MPLLPERVLRASSIMRKTKKEREKKTNLKMKKTQNLKMRKSKIKNEKKKTN